MDLFSLAPVLQFLGSCGSAGAALIVVFLFLKYVAARDKQLKDMTDQMMAVIEKNAEIMGKLGQQIETLPDTVQQLFNTQHQGAHA